MAWVRVPPEHHPIFFEALPADARVQTMRMFGGVAAKVNGHIFAGLFGRSTMLLLPEPARAEALALEGAGPFDPMGNGRVMSDKVMLPESMMEEPDELRRWIARAFEAAALLPGKLAKTPVKKPVNKPATKAAAKKTTVTKKTPTKKPAPKAGKRSAPVRKPRR